MFSIFGGSSSEDEDTVTDRDEINQVLQSLTAGDFIEAKPASGGKQRLEVTERAGRYMTVNSDNGSMVVDTQHGTLIKPESKSTEIGITKLWPPQKPKMKLSDLE
jgi:hypothetical protein